jgi:hypothetical protein
MDQLAHRAPAGPRVRSPLALRRQGPEPGRQVLAPRLRITAAQAAACCVVLGAL